MSIGPRKLLPTASLKPLKPLEVQKLAGKRDPKLAALEPLQRDLDLLNRQRGVLAKILSEMVAGYQNVVKRVRASGDERLAVDALTQLDRLAKVCAHFARHPGMQPQEAQALFDQGKAMAQTATLLGNSKVRIASLQRKLTLDLQVLAALQQELGRMESLQIDPESFYRSVGKAQVLRREATAKK